MAEAALAVGYKYIAITDHSKILAMTGGLDEKRALEHIKNIREVDRRMEGRIRVFTGIEVDILADGALDMDDEVLAQMDVVIASVHTRFEQSREEMTARVLRAIENPNVRILGHPTGRLLLRREPFAIDMGAVLRRAAELGVAVEHNAAPERLDLNDRDLRLAKELGCRIVDQFGLPRQPQPGEDGVRDPPAQARLAGAGGRAEYAGSKGFAGVRCGAKG